jgi:hypothetical protein
MSDKALPCAQSSITAQPRVIIDAPDSEQDQHSSLCHHHPDTCPFSLPDSIIRMCAPRPALDGVCTLGRWPGAWALPYPESGEVHGPTSTLTGIKVDTLDTLVSDLFAPVAREVMLEAFSAARCISTPLVAMLTLDYASTIARICDDLQGKAAVLGWDIVRGLYGQNEAGAEAVRELLGPQVDMIAATRSGEVLAMAAGLPPEPSCLSQRPPLSPRRDRGPGLLESA